MTAYSINAVKRRVNLSGSAGTGPYAFTFEIIVNTDVAVFLDTTLLTLTTDYAVTINSNGTGSVTLNTGTTNVPNAPTGSNTVTIVGARSIERTTDFVTAGDLKASSLNEQLDALTIFDQQISERVDRALIANLSDPTTIDMTLPAKADRAGKVLGFNSSTGNPEVTQQVTGAAVNVSGLSAGASPTASVSVSNGTATFALGIPAGATGAAGAAGADGADSTVAGPQGPAGAAGDNTITVKDEGSALSTAASTLNFVGSGVTASGTGAEKTVTITDTDTTYSVQDGGLSQNNFTNTLKSKLDGIETSATADQSNAEIKSAYEANSDTNAFSDAEKTKLSGISSSANNYSLPTASSTTLGGIKIGSGLSIDGSGVVTSSGGGGGGSGEANQNAFSNVAVSGQSTVAADAATDTLNLAAGSNVTITTTAGTDTVTIASTDTDTTYSVGDGGLTQNNFTNTLKTKLDGIDASADVTDATNVTAAGALMDSEVTNLAQVKAFSASDYATAAQGTKADAALPKAGGTLSGDIDGNGNKVLFANVYTALTDLPSASTYHGMFAHVHNEGKGYFAHGGNWIELANNSQIPTVGDGGLSEINFTSADHTKLNGIATSANNYVHPNHSGEVTSAADGATVVADNVIDEANLKVSNSPTNGYALTAQSGNTGGLTWAAISGGSYTHPNHSGEVTSTGDGATVIADNVVDEANLKVSNSPTNGYVLTAQSGNTGGLTWAAASGGSGGGADLYAAETTGATDPTASGTESIGIGSDARSTGVESIAIGKDTYSTGSNSIAIGVDSTGRGATANDAIAIGENTYASTTRGLAIGNNVTAEANTCVNIGYLCTSYNGAYSTSVGNNNTLDANFTLALGTECDALHSNSGAIGSIVATRGPCSLSYAAKTGLYGVQKNEFYIQANTTDATPRIMNGGGTSVSATKQVMIGSNSAYSFHGTIVARQKASQGTACAAWEVKGLLRREAGESTTVLVMSAITVLNNTPNWGLAMSADTTEGALAITVTGQSSTNILWGSVIHTSDVFWP